jgi:hypothetical protein
MKKIIVIMIFLLLNLFIINSATNQIFIYQDSNLSIKNFSVLKIQKLENYNSKIPIYPPEKENQRTSNLECILGSGVFFGGSFIKRLKSDKKKIKKEPIK